MIRQFLPVLTLALLPAVALADAAERSPATQPAANVEHYEYRFNGSRVGSGSVTEQEVDHDGQTVRQITMRYEMVMTMFGVESRTTGRSVMLETFKGEPISYEGSSNSDGEVSTLLIEFEPTRDGFRAVKTMGDGETTRTSVEDIPADAMTYFASDQWFRQWKPYRVGSTARMTLIMPDVQYESALTDYEVTYRGEEDVELIEGGTVKARAYDYSMSFDGVPFPGKAWVADGNVVRTDMPMGGMNFEIHRVETISRDWEAVALNEWLVIPAQSTKTIQEPYLIDRARYLLRLRREVDIADDALPETSIQRVRRISAPKDTPPAYEITVRTFEHYTDVPTSTLSDELRERALASSKDVNLSDEVVRKLSSEWRGNAETDWDKAVALTEAVYERIEGTYAVSWGTASETARSLRGDCSECGVLLVALLRANGIPARAVRGLSYADWFEGETNVFVYHMWVQAYIDNRWIDLDGTVPQGYYPDSGRIAFGFMYLDEDSEWKTFTQDIVGEMAFRGNTDIRILSYRKFGEDRERSLIRRPTTQPARDGVIAD